MTIGESILYYSLTFLVSGPLINLPLVIFGVLGLILASKGKKPTWCFAVGIIIMLIIWVGYIYFVAKGLPDKVFTKEIVCIMFAVVFVAITIPVSAKLYRKRRNTHSIDNNGN